VIADSPGNTVRTRVGTLTLTHSHWLNIGWKTCVSSAGSPMSGIPYLRQPLPRLSGTDQLDMKKLYTFTESAKGTNHLWLRHLEFSWVVFFFGLQSLISKLPAATMKWQRTTRKSVGPAEMRRQTRNHYDNLGIPQLCPNNAYSDTPQLYPLVCSGWMW
jgi:hypothetical protein